MKVQEVLTRNLEAVGSLNPSEIGTQVSNGGPLVTKTREENLGFDQYHRLVEPPDHQI